MSYDKIINFGKKWGFNDIEESKILIQAFTHKSYKNSNSGHFERLEFLGDSILGAIISYILYKKMPECDEGILSRMKTNLVNKSSLASASKQLDFDKLILMGENEIKLKYNQNEKVLADIYEAFIGALFYEKGFEICETFVLKTLDNNFENVLEHLTKKDPKSTLQEYTHLNYNETPIYEVISHEFVDNRHHFEVQIIINEKVVGFGSGADRKSAEQMAASHVLKSMVVN